MDTALKRHPVLVTALTLLIPELILLTLLQFKPEISTGSNPEQS